ncbi:MAG: PEP-CTERM sorting domain-containing protein [Planctomycetia bacterium]|nr:PEP-CTERM sorting domain-containing protein [Planctomycetia bacterium]
MTSKKLLLAGLVAALGLAGTSQAAVIHVAPKLRAVLASDFTPIDPAPDASALPALPGGKYILQVDFLMKIDGLQAGQLGFGNAAVNINATGIAQAADFPGWQADDWRVDKNGPGPGGGVNKWLGNQDSGANSSDLQNILIENAPKDLGAVGVDARTSLGIEPYDNNNLDPLDAPVTPWSDGEYFGTVFFEISGEAGTQGSVSVVAAEGSTYDAQGLLSAVGVTGAPAQSLAFAVQAVPEPSTFALLGLGGALLAFARKRR